MGRFWWILTIIVVFVVGILFILAIANNSNSGDGSGGDDNETNGGIDNGTGGSTGGNTGGNSSGGNLTGGISNVTGSANETHGGSVNQTNVSGTGGELPETRSFEMGNLPVPEQPITTESWIRTFDSIADGGEVVLTHEHVDWANFVSSSDPADESGLAGIKFVSAMAEQRNMELFIVVDYRGNDGTGFGGTALGEDFSDPEVRNAFKNFAVRLARDYSPKYLGLGSEVNTYMNLNSGDADNLRSLIAETRAAVKDAAPATIVTSTFQYEEMIDKNEWNYFDAVEPSVDMVAITTYPSLKFSSPSAIPENYYKQVRSHSSKPLIIAESGWPSEGTNYHGSEANLDAFLDRVVELNSGNDLKLWIYWFVHDWAGEEYGDYFKSMGLKKSDGTPKSAWEIWKRIGSLPIN